MLELQVYVCVLASRAGVVIVGLTVLPSLLEVGNSRSFVWRTCLRQSTVVRPRESNLVLTDVHPEETYRRWVVSCWYSIHRPRASRLDESLDKLYDVATDCSCPRQRLVGRQVF